AEDGIRDDLVTGVQTCALPILDGLHTKHITVQTKFRPHLTEREIETYSEAESDADADSDGWSDGTSNGWQNGDTNSWATRTTGEIGRASCRERVKNQGVGERGK